MKTVRFLSLVLFFSFNLFASPMGTVVFVWERVPNLQELVIDCAFEVPVQLLFGELISKLGKNPAAKTIVRNIQKLPATEGKIRTNAQVGTTKYVFDESHRFSGLTKVSTQTVAIVLAAVGGFEVSRAAEVSNLPSDVLARALIKLGQDRQRDQSALSFFRYMLERGDIKLVLIGAMTETVPKVLVMLALGEYYKNSGVSDKVRYSFELAGNVTSDWADQVSGDDYLAEIEWTVYKTASGTSYAVGIFADAMVTTTVMATISRVIMDGVAQVDWRQDHSLAVIPVVLIANHIAKDKTETVATASRVISGSMAVGSAVHSTSMFVNAYQKMMSTALKNSKVFGADSRAIREPARKLLDANMFGKISHMVHEYPKEVKNLFWGIAGVLTSLGVLFLL